MQQEWYSNHNSITLSEKISGPILANMKKMLIFQSDNQQIPSF